MVARARSHRTAQLAAGAPATLHQMMFDVHSWPAPNGWTLSVTMLEECELRYRVDLIQQEPILQTLESCTFIGFVTSVAFARKGSVDQFRLIQCRRPS